NDNKDKRVVESVAYELMERESPRRLRVVRGADSGDLKGFIRTDLTRDGRYYLWVGPRSPGANRRVEVREVATGRQIITIPRPGRDESPFCLSPNGKRLWVESSEKGLMSFDLPDSPSGAPSARPLPTAVTADLHWIAQAMGAYEESPFPTVTLRR